MHEPRQMCRTNVDGVQVGLPSRTALEGTIFRCLTLMPSTHLFSIISLHNLLCLYLSPFVGFRDQASEEYDGLWSSRLGAESLIVAPERGHPGSVTFSSLLLAYESLQHTNRWYRRTHRKFHRL